MFGFFVSLLSWLTIHCHPLYLTKADSKGWSKRENRVTLIFPISHQQILDKLSKFVGNTVTYIWFITVWFIDQLLSKFSSRTTASSPGVRIRFLLNFFNCLSERSPFNSGLQNCRIFSDRLLPSTDWVCPLNKQKFNASTGCIKSTACLWSKQEYEA